MATKVTEVEVEDVEEAEAEADEEELTTENAYSCPTCGMVFSESAMCEKHTRFCLQDDEPSIKWSDDRLFLLIDCMQARYKKFVQMSPKQRKQHWKWVGKILGVSSEDARTRWNHLTASYNRVKIAAAQGRPRGTPWRFFSRMDKVVGEGVLHRPEFVLSSMPLDDAPNEEGTVQPHTGMLLSTEGEGEGASTDKLIELMEERYDKYTKILPSTSKSRKLFWRGIGEELNIPPEEARIRWNMVVNSFKRSKTTRTNFMKRYGREPRNKWRYFDRMERIIGDRFNSVMPLTVLSSREKQSDSSFSLATGANFLTASKPLPNIAPAAPAAATPPAGSQPAPAGLFKLGPNGMLQAVTPAAATTVLQAGTPQQQQADTETFATKRKALFVEDYLRAKARREEQRLQLEERRIRALERLVDVMEGRGNS